MKSEIADKKVEYKIWSTPVQDIGLKSEKSYFRLT